MFLANEICNWVENSEIQLCDDASGLRFSIHESLSNYRVWKKNQQVTFALEQAKTKLEKGFWKIDSIFWAFLRYWSPFYLYFILNRICCCHRTEFNTLSSFWKVHRKRFIPSPQDISHWSNRTHCVDEDVFRIKWCFLKLRCKHLTCWILKMTKYLNFSHFLHHFGMSFVWQFKCDSKVACIKLNFVKLSVCMQSIWQFAHPTRYIHFSLTFTNVFATSSFLHQFNYYTDKPLHLYAITSTHATQPKIVFRLER